jgi:hypothetical protein
VKPVAWTIAPQSSSATDPDSCAIFTAKRPGAPAVSVTVELRCTLIFALAETFAASSAAPTGWASA